MLSDAELNGMRAAVALTWPDTCNILTVAQVADGYGGVTETWTTAYSNVACRLDMRSGREPAIGGAVQQFTSYMLSLPYDTVIDEANRVTVNGITYAVTSINENQSWPIVKRVTLEEIE